MAEYLLICGQPRFAKAVPHVLYDAERLQAAHPDDDAAIRWACDQVPHPPVPMVLWRIRGTNREMIWMTAV
jgi:hypothetical protein